MDAIGSMLKFLVGTAVTAIILVIVLGGVLTYKSCGGNTYKTHKPLKADTVIVKNNNVSDTTYVYKIK
jgi:hypothetical protein